MSKITLLITITLFSLQLSNQNVYSKYSNKCDNEKQMAPNGKFCIYRHVVGIFTA